MRGTWEASAKESLRVKCKEQTSLACFQVFNTGEKTLQIKLRKLITRNSFPHLPPKASKYSSLSFCILKQKQYNAC